MRSACIGLLASTVQWELEAETFTGWMGGAIRLFETDAAKKNPTVSISSC